ncbi:hypothetical protein ACSSS7_000859 [Eimeria intestinalis]
MRKASRSLRASKASSVSKKLVGGFTGEAEDGRRSLTSEDAYKLLEQHCRGMWSDGDDEEVKTPKEAEHISEAGQANQEASSHSQCSEDRKGSDPTCSFPGSAKSAKRKKRKGTATPEEGCAPAASRPPAGNIGEDEDHRALERAGHTVEAPVAGDVRRQETQQKQKTPSKRQAKGVRRWSAMRSRAAASFKFEAAALNEGPDPSAAQPLPLARSASESLKFLKEVSGLASSSQGKAHDVFIRETTRRAEALMAEDAGEEKLREVEAEISALSEKFRALNNSGELSDAVFNQQQRLIGRATEALAVHLQRLSRPSSFSFKRRAAPPGSNVSSASRGEATKAQTSANELNLASEEDGKLAASPLSNVLSISGLANAVLLVGPGAARGREIWLRGLDGCTVYVADRVPCARLHEIKNSAVMLLRVSSAAWIQSCAKCLFSVDAQQLRVHDSLDVSFFLNIGSSPIIERTSGAVFAAPVCFLKSDEQDGQGQSPNWRLLEGPAPQARFIRCVRRDETSESQQNKAPSADPISSFIAQSAEGEMPEMLDVASACWRLVGVSPGLSAAALMQHSTAAAAAVAVISSLKELQT